MREKILDSVACEKLWASAQAALLIVQADRDSNEVPELVEEEDEDWRTDDFDLRNDQVFADCMPSARARQDLVVKLQELLSPLATRPEAVHRILDAVRGRMAMPGGTNRGRLERSVLRQIAEFPCVLRTSNIPNAPMALSAMVMGCAPPPSSKLNAAFAAACLPGREAFCHMLATRRQNIRAAKRADGGLFMPKKKPRGKLVGWIVKQSAYDCWIRKSKPRMDRTSGNQPRVSIPRTHARTHAPVLIYLHHARRNLSSLQKA
jgi:hypothetical protein